MGMPHSKNPYRGYIWPPKCVLLELAYDIRHPVSCYLRDGWNGTKATLEWMFGKR